jgi:hypothetical protein
MILYLCARIDINSFLAYSFILLRFCIFLYCFFDLDMGSGFMGDRLGYCRSYKTFDRGKWGDSQSTKDDLPYGRSQIEKQSETWFHL